MQYRLAPLNPANPTPHLILHLAGDLTLDQAADLKLAFLDALSKAESLTIDLGEVGRADLTFLQILLAARLSARSCGKILSLRIPGAPPILGGLAELAGFQHAPGQWMGIPLEKQA